MHGNANAQATALASPRVAYGPAACWLSPGARPNEALALEEAAYTKLDRNLKHVHIAQQHLQEAASACEQASAHNLRVRAEVAAPSAPVLPSLEPQSMGWQGEALAVLRGLQHTTQANNG